ncbi:MAG: ThuA domain-containing protein [Pirellulales bacterium]|nr:ThuA domain-containing protein [Pirellulales bacterium]
MRAALLSRTVPVVALLLSLISGAGAIRAGEVWVEYSGGQGPGQGRHIVFVTGDEEYRSEESMPMLAKIAAARHGFKCTVLFAINPKDGTIDPIVTNNIPGLAALDSADLMVLFTRFRDLPPEQMKHVLDYVNSGRPIIALRTATHPFRYPADSPLAQWSFDAADGGFGGRVLGQTWINHYGNHMGTSTRAKVVPQKAGHPVLRGVSPVFWGPSDVYGVLPLRGDCTPLVMGEVAVGKTPDGPPQEGKILQPVVWIKTYTGAQGKPSRVLTTTMGHCDDLKSEDLRRLLINACYWATGLADKIPPKANVEYLSPYEPNAMGFGGFKKGLKPADHAMGD